MSEKNQTEERPDIEGMAVRYAYIRTLAATNIMELIQYIYQLEQAIEAWNTRRGGER